MLALYGRSTRPHNDRHRDRDRLPLPRRPLGAVGRGPVDASGVVEPDDIALRRQHPHPHRIGLRDRGRPAIGPQPPSANGQCAGDLTRHSNHAVGDLALRIRHYGVARRLTKGDRSAPSRGTKIQGVSASFAAGHGVFGRPSVRSAHFDAMPRSPAVVWRIRGRGRADQAPVPCLSCPAFFG